MMDVSFRKIAKYDVIAFVASLLCGFSVACLVMILVYTQWFGGRPIEESPGEILLGYSLIFATTWLVLYLRAEAVGRVLREGTVVEARVTGGSHFETFAHVTLAYRVGGTDIARKTVQLPNSKRARALIEQKTVRIAVRPERPRRVVVYDLYVESPVAAACTAA